MYCECGCGQKTEKYIRNSMRDNTKKGDYKRFIYCHQNRRLIKHDKEIKEGQFYNKGYVYVHAPYHPNPTQGKYVERSRLVMEKKLNRFLLSTEYVHHKNEIRDDDSPENLELSTLPEHNRLHGKIRRNKKNGIK